MEHRMKLWDGPFNKIKYDKKDIELRLNDAKRQLIKVGDTIVFTHNQTKEEIVCEVTNLYRYPTFKDMYESFNKERLGYSFEEEASYLDMEKFYLKSEIEKYGVLGIEIKKI